jgi:hypothetical protein
MRVVSLESPLKGHQPLYVLNFLFLIFREAGGLEAFLHGTAQNFELIKNKKLKT